MLYIEMSRDMAHGGGAWAFPQCVWSPSRKRNGGKWPFWEKVLQIKDGDTVLHLRGKPPQAYFVGFSVAAGDGFLTSRRPPVSSQWEYAENFYRADLSQFTPFHEPVSLSRIFSARRDELDAYFERNKKARSKLNIFYVRQAGRLQCLNGAYLSEADEELLFTLFGRYGAEIAGAGGETVVSHPTGTQIATVASRIGQRRFALAVKDNYGGRCCFPACEVDDPRFLVGAHIARWSDVEELRGDVNNGICLCVWHDRAFELGLFTLDEELRVFVNPRETRTSRAVRELSAHHGEKIALPRIPPSDDALVEHWLRVGIEPWTPK